MQDNTAGGAPGFMKHPDYEITIRAANGRYVATMGETILADSSNALVLDEQGYDPVLYFPRKSVNFEALVPADRTTRCPFKGEAEHYARAGETGGGVIAWSYPRAYDEVADIAGRIAFYPERVGISRADE